MTDALREAAQALLETADSIRVEGRVKPQDAYDLVGDCEALRAALAAPPPRTAVPLTDEEIGKIAVAADNEYGAGEDWAFMFARAIERSVWAKSGIVGGME